MPLATGKKQKISNYSLLLCLTRPFHKLSENEPRKQVVVLGTQIFKRGLSPFGFDGVAIGSRLRGNDEQ